MDTTSTKKKMRVYIINTYNTMGDLIDQRVASDLVIARTIAYDRGIELVKDWAGTTQYGGETPSLRYQEGKGSRINKFHKGQEMFRLVTMTFKVVVYQLELENHPWF